MVLSDFKMLRFSNDGRQQRQLLKFIEMLILFDLNFGPHILLAVLNLGSTPAIEFFLLVD